MIFKTWEKRIISMILALVLLSSLVLMTSCEKGGGEHLPAVMIYEAYTSGGYFSGTDYAVYEKNYIVLYNSSAEAVDLEDFTLLSCSPEGEIISDRSARLSGTIQPDSFFVIEGGQATDAFERKMGVDLPFEIDLTIDNLVPKRKHGIIVLYRGSHTANTVALNDKDIEDYLAYGEVNPLMFPAGTGPAIDPSVNKILRRRSFKNSFNNADDFTTRNIANKPGHIIYYTRGLTGIQLANIKKDTDGIVELSHVSGMYDSEFGLEITTTLTGNASIYYTIDGSVPISTFGVISPTAIKYTGAIPIKDRTGEPSIVSHIPMSVFANDEGELRVTWPPDKSNDETEEEYLQRLDDLFAGIYKGNVIRASAINDDDIVTPSVLASYFVNQQNFSERFGMPVISIVTEIDGLYNEDYGIFMPNNLYSEESNNRVPAVVEFFEEDGTKGFTEEVRFQTNGGSSRKFPRKSFRIYNSSTDFSYDLFEGLVKNIDGETITNFDRYILRNGGQDRRTIGLRDAFWQRLCAQLGTFEYQAQRYATVFLNGEYWGMYTITERQDEHYISYRYNIPRDDVVMSEGFAALRRGDEDVWRETAYNLRDFVFFNDMNVAENYKYFTDNIEVDSYIDFFITSILGGNSDWPNNNMRMWKNANVNAKTNTKWRMMMYDCDPIFDTRLNPGIHSYLDFLLTKNEEEEEKFDNTQMFRILMENEEFRTAFINRSEELINGLFSAENIIKEFNELKKVVEPSALEHCERWDIETEYWDESIADLMTLIPERVESFRQEINALKTRY